MAQVDPATLRGELQKQRRKVDFDTYDITVDELVRRVSRRKVEISPAYQRQFRWGADRQSKLVESIILGIPVPPLFMATNVEADEGRTWEVVDGLQRLLSMTNFVGDSGARAVARLDGVPLRLSGLEALPSFNGLAASDLPADVRDGLLDRPVKVVVLNDKSDLQVRFDLFERLNTGGVRLTDQEVREAVFGGPFVDLLSELTKTDQFNSVVNLQTGKQKDGTPQEFVLRFFAFYDRYRSFDHSVKDFLNDYCESAAKEPLIELRRTLFNRTFKFLADTFPSGVHRGQRSITPVNVYEAVAVGAAFALDSRERVPRIQSIAWIESDKFRKLTTGATNDRKRVVGRIEYARDRFLAGE